MRTADNQKREERKSGERHGRHAIERSVGHPPRKLGPCSRELAQHARQVQVVEEAGQDDGDRQGELAEEAVRPEDQAAAAPGSAPAGEPYTARNCRAAP